MSYIRKRQRKSGVTYQAVIQVQHLNGKSKGKSKSFKHLRDAKAWLRLCEQKEVTKLLHGNVNAAMTVSDLIDAYLQYRERP